MKHRPLNLLWTLTNPAQEWLKQGRRRNQPRRGRLALEQLEDRTVPTLVTNLVKVINPTGGSFPGPMVNVNGTLLFSATDGVNGQELWKSDGTAAGTVMVKDIFPGSDPFGSPNGSFPGLLTNVKGTLFFTADDGVNGSELWKSDGTAAGTALVKDINPGAGGSLVAEGEPIEMVPMRVPSRFNPAGPQPRDLVFLTAGDGTHGRELWVSDGTAAGTVLVQDIFPGSDSFGAPNSSFPHNLTPVGGTLFFAANDGTNGVQLWATHNVPVITSVNSTTANGTYGAGANINVTVTFDTPMTLAGGNLTVRLNDGATVTVAPFANSFTASGTYTVAPGQMANPLDTIAFALAAGATIRDADGNEAVLTIPAGASLRDLKNIIINAHVPVITQATSSTANGTYGARANINVTVQFDTALTLSGGNLRINLNDGAVVVIPPFSNSATVSGTYVVRPGDVADPLDTDEAQAVRRQQQQRLGLVRRKPNRLASRVMNASTVTADGLIAPTPEAREQLLRAGVVLVGPGSGLTVNCTTTGAVPASYEPPTLNALLDTEYDEGIEAAIRQRDAGIFLRDDGFPLGCISALVAESEALRKPGRYVR